MAALHVRSRTLLTHASRGGTLWNMALLLTKVNDIRGNASTRPVSSFLDPCSPLTITANSCKLFAPSAASPPQVCSNFASRCTTRTAPAPWKLQSYIT